MGHNCAHRGYFGKDQRPPENSLPAFAAAAQNGYGIELDVQFTSDRRLVVFHDDTLDRMTPAKGFVHDMDWADFSAQPLAGSNEHPPLFADMLRTVAETNPDTPLIVEIKSRAEYSKTYLEELCRATIAELKAYPGPYCIESFDPRVVGIVRRQAPDILRGQLGRQLPELPQGWDARRSGVCVLPPVRQLSGAAGFHRLVPCQAQLGREAQCGLGRYDGHVDGPARA